jgi:protein KRI1
MHTLRRKDESRKEKRLARLERKAAERQAKEEELRRLKNAKRQEIQRKLQQVKAVLGETQQGHEGIDAEGAMDEATILKLLEGDFDPQKFEELMKEAYGDNFYARPDAQWKNDRDVRGTLQRDEDGELLVGQDTEDGGLYDNIDDKAADDSDHADEDHPDDDDWMEDDEDDQEFQEEQGETDLEKKVKSKLMDELYKLDYEDIVAGQPTRFKYRKVEPNSFGLSAEEILFARDSTLKQFVSLKKIAPYRDEEYCVNSKRRRRFRDMLKHDIEEEISSQLPAEASVSKQPREQERNPAEGNEEATGKKRKKNRRLKQKKKQDDATTKEPVNPGEHSDREENAKKVAPHPKDVQPQPAERPTKEVDDPKVGQASATRSKKRKRKSKKEKVEGIPNSRLASYGF